MAFKIPLAWLQLSREKMRLLVALAGIGFADILMFMQLGFRDALFDSAVNLHKNLEGDIFLISPQSTALIAMKSFPRRRMYQALAYEGVESANPIYLGFGIWKNPEDRSTRQLMIIGFNPAEPILKLPGLEEKLPLIKMPDVLLFDDASRAEFGPVGEWLNQGKTVETEIDGRRIKVGDVFTLGASFGADGNVITSDLNFLRLSPRRDPGLIDVASLKVAPGTNVDALIAKMRQEFTDVKVLSHQDFMDFEKSYWESGTSIGFIFSLGTAMGFIVGTVIVYQILYTDVNDHLAEYATLKAMGYTDFYLLTVVFQEAVILAVLGYLPGGIIASGLYVLTKNATNLPMFMTLGRAIVVLLLTVVMCLVSGMIAVRKLNAADPADIF